LNFHHSFPWKEAISCVAFARKRGVPIVINDRLDIAMACDADGVHLGQQDIPVSRARAILGPHKIIGASCKTVEQAQRAFQDGADYIGCGGVYPTTTKQNNPTLGIQGLHVVCKGSPLPVVAIGGINASNAKDIFVPRPPKLCGVAVVSALFDRADVMAEASQLAKMLSEI
jgi:hydroxymethylpyrimidine kinase/phosphomethylpyrimidine kinase/thiamine-phosphate diphosphorylase